MTEARDLTADWAGQALDDKGVADFDSGIGTMFPERAFTVAPIKQPDVSAPLGWTLSASSQQALDCALDAYTGAPCSATVSDRAPAARTICSKSPAQCRRSATYRILSVAFRRASG